MSFRPHANVLMVQMISASGKHEIMSPHTVRMLWGSH